MNNEEKILRIKELVKPLLDPDLFLVEVKIKPIDNVKVFLDADHGLPIEKCIQINRALYKRIDEDGLFNEGEFSLEVSSPGLGEPLKLHRQYVKNKGREIEVSLSDNTVKLGKLVDVTDQGIVLEYREGKGKKSVFNRVDILFKDIKQSKVQIKF